MTNRLLTSVCAAAGCTFMVLQGQEAAPRTVYTAAQAEAGHAAFQSTCGKCHTGALLRRTGRGRRTSSSRLPSSRHAGGRSRCRR